jgi:hypothetical protein
MVQINFTNINFELWRILKLQGVKFILKENEALSK